MKKFYNPNTSNLECLRLAISQLYSLAISQLYSLDISYCYYFLSIHAWYCVYSRSKFYNSCVCIWLSLNSTLFISRIVIIFQLYMLDIVFILVPNQKELLKHLNS